MFEYTNRGLILLGGLVIFSTIMATIAMMVEAKKKNKKTISPFIGAIAVILMIGMLIMDSSDTKHRIENNIALFQANKEIQCSTLSSTYLVSKQGGWRLHGEAFTKDSLLLDAKSCRESKR